MDMRLGLAPGLAPGLLLVIRWITLTHLRHRSSRTCRIDRRNCPPPENSKTTLKTKEKKGIGKGTREDVLVGRVERVGREGVLRGWVEKVC